MVQGDERKYATILYRLATRLALKIHGSDALATAKVRKEFARQLEERHNENGKPENSRWNRSYAVPEDALSAEARQLYREARVGFSMQAAIWSSEVAGITMALAKLVKNQPSDGG